jgi:hypothetical protein
MLFLIQHGPIRLGPDEAQYWTWSRELGWGYYSKPPGIAWQIWAGCLAFGQTELGVRIGAVAIAILLSAAVYLLARACKLSPSQSAWAAALMALVPLGILASLFAITDGGMVLCWTLAMALCVSRPQPNDLLLGLVIAMGALFKWPIYFFWIVRLLWGSLHRPLWSQKLLAGMGVSLLGLIPSLAWNARHDWVTFKHVFYTLYAESGPQPEHPGLGSGNPLEFLGAQIALLSPVVFTILLLSFGGLWRRRAAYSSPLGFCGFSSILILTLGLGLSCLKKMQGNWMEFAYPGAIVWITGYAFEAFKRPQRWIGAGIGVSIALSAFAFALPILQGESLLASTPIPYKANPFRHNLGWDRLSSALTQAGYNPDSHFLFSDKYQTTSLISFYGPEQKRAYFFNLHGIRLNQFSFWPGMPEEQKGKTGFFVLADNIPKGKESLRDEALRTEALLKPYFAETHVKGPFPLFEAYGKPVKEAWVIECTGYNGAEPPKADRY